MSPGITHAGRVAQRTYLINCHAVAQVSDLVEKVSQGRRVHYKKLTAKERPVWDGIRPKKEEQVKVEAAAKEDS
jgi:hypothetical protein